MEKILLIGCGHMGSALLSSWIRSKKYKITVVDTIKYNYLKKKFKNKSINILKSILVFNELINFDFIVIATRPKDLSKVLNGLSKIGISKTTTLISVIAGKKINEFKKNLKHNNNIFRVMPNMPAAIGQSMNCVVANKFNKTKINKVIKLFSYSGKTILLENENQIDMATAISGSGPGFVFNIVDAMEQAAINLGFNSKTAKILVAQTFSGSVKLLQTNKSSAKDLVKSVATKGGTTEAGLKIMNKNKLHKIFKELTKASYIKAKEQAK